jgi:hypothetical protein
MDIESLKEEWKNDCVIVDTHLGEASTSTPNLHSKYLNYLVDAKIKCTKYKNDLNVLKKNKSKWMRGEMSKEELDVLGWGQWEYNKLLKSEIAETLLGDDDVIKQSTKVEYFEVVIMFLESVLGQIKSRDFQIKNGITWKTFLAGN